MNMDNNLIAVIIGIVEGVTEFLPVSSTGHMIIVGNMLGFDGPVADLFDVFIQLGAILSVVFIYKERFCLMYLFSLAQYFRWFLFTKNALHAFLQKKAGSRIKGSAYGMWQPESYP